MTKANELLQNNPFYGNIAMYLSGFNIHVLRSIGREVGVESPATRKKNDLIDEIVLLLLELQEPVERSKRGAPVKEEAPDPIVMEEIYRRKQFALAKREEQPAKDMCVCSQDKKARMMDAVGLLSFSKNGGSLILDPMKSFSIENIFVTAEQIKEYSLREGDLVCCRYEQTDEGNKMAGVITVNGRCVGEYEDRALYEEFAPVYPEESLFLPESGVLPDSLAMGKGQRALLLGDRTCVYEFFKKAAKAIYKKDNMTDVYVLLLGGVREEAEELKDSLSDASVYAFDLAASAERKIGTVELLCMRAKRVAEEGGNCVIMISSLSSLALAYAMTERENEDWASRLSAETVAEIQKLFGLGRKLKNGGSVTTLVHIDPKEKFAEELKAFFGGTENCRVEWTGSGEISKNSFLLRKDKIR